MLLCAGCDDGMADGPDEPASDCFALDVSVPLASSRAEDDELNEYTVRSLHLYFFPATGHSDATSRYVYDVEVGGEFVFSRQLRLPLPDDALADYGLFGPDANTCFVYAVANVGADNLQGRTVDELKATAVDSHFDETVVQDAFAMDCLATITLDRSRRVATGTITLERAAAKLTLSVDLPKSIDVEHTIISPIDGTTQVVNITYHSRPDDMHVWISNGVMKSKLNTAATEADEENLYSNSIYAAEGVGSPFTFDAAQPKYSYLQDVPFYSYPNKWNSYSPKGNCFLTLEIPWYYTDSTGATQNIVTYYRLSVQPGKDCIERNTHYDMRVTIGRLGGTSVQKPVDMLFDWNYSMKWNIQTLLTDIKEIRYLLLNNNDFSTQLDAYAYTMENETTIAIPYNTSHPVEIESVELSWRDYKENTDRRITLSASGSGYLYNTPDGYSPLQHFAGIEIDAANSTLKLKRDLLHIAWSGGRPAIRNEAAINAYTFRINLRHIDAEAGYPSSHASVVITQIPAIYITTQLTGSGRRFINNQNTTYRTNTGSSWRPVYVYKGYISTSSSYPSNTQQQRHYLGSYHNSDTYVQNKNTYILTISKFAEGDNYIIADPRTRTIDNLNESGLDADDDAGWSMNDGTGRPLKYYYPADRDAAKTRFIAPQLRVASQWGVTYPVSRRGAERRCASYQEDGRPAGRWRLPTAAEIEYISRLSNKQYIPYLFGTEGGTATYWCATGVVNVDNDTNNPSVSLAPDDNEQRAVRCVYDEWFWNTDTLTTKTAFRWGDRPRTVTGN